MDCHPSFFRFHCLCSSLRPLHYFWTFIESDILGHCNGRQNPRQNFYRTNYFLVACVQKYFGCDCKKNTIRSDFLDNNDRENEDETLKWDEWEDDRKWERAREKLKTKASANTQIYLYAITLLQFSDEILWAQTLWNRTFCWLWIALSISFAPHISFCSIQLWCYSDISGSGKVNRNETHPNIVTTMLR